MEGSEEEKPGCETAGGEMLSEDARCSLRCFATAGCAKEERSPPPEGPGAFGGRAAPQEHFLASHVGLISQPADSFPLSEARGAACVKEPLGRSGRVPPVIFVYF